MKGARRPSSVRRCRRSASGSVIAASGDAVTAPTSARRGGVRARAVRRVRGERHAKINGAQPRDKRPRARRLAGAGAHRLRAGRGAGAPGGGGFAPTTPTPTWRTRVIRRRPGHTNARELCWAHRLFQAAAASAPRPLHRDALSSYGASSAAGGVRSHARAPRAARARAPRRGRSRFSSVVPSGRRRGDGAARRRRRAAAPIGRRRPALQLIPAPVLSPGCAGSSRETAEALRGGVRPVPAPRAKSARERHARAGRRRGVRRGGRARRPARRRRRRRRERRERRERSRCRDQLLRVFSAKACEEKGGGVSRGGVVRALLPGRVRPVRARLRADAERDGGPHARRGSRAGARRARQAGAVRAPRRASPGNRRGTAEPPCPDASPAFDVVDNQLNAAHRALSEDDDRDAVCAAMEAAAEVIKSVARRDGVDLDAAGAADVGAAGPGAARLHAGKHVEGLAALCLRACWRGARCARRTRTTTSTSDPIRDSVTRGDSSDEDEDEEAELGVVVLEGCAELLPALVAVAGANAAAAFEPHFAALARRVGPSRPEGQRSVAYAWLKADDGGRLRRGAGSGAGRARRAAGTNRRMAGAHTAGLRRNPVRTAPAFSLSSAAKRSPASARRSSRRSAGCWRAKAGTGRGRRRMPGRATTRRARRRARSRGKRRRGARRAAGRRAMDALLAGVPLREDFEECASVRARARETRRPRGGGPGGDRAAGRRRPAGGGARRGGGGAKYVTRRPEGLDRENRPGRARRSRSWRRP